MTYYLGASNENRADIESSYCIIVLGDSVKGRVLVGDPVMRQGVVVYELRFVGVIVIPLTRILYYAYGSISSKYLLPREMLHSLVVIPSVVTPDHRPVTVQVMSS